MRKNTKFGFKKKFEKKSKKIFLTQNAFEHSF